MFEISSFLDKSKIKNYLKSYKLALIYSFIVGLIMGSIPFFYKLNVGHKSMSNTLYIS